MGCDYLTAIVCQSGEKFISKCKIVDHLGMSTFKGNYIVKRFKRDMGMAAHKGIILNLWKVFLQTMKWFFCDLQL